MSANYRIAREKFVLKQQYKNDNYCVILASSPAMRDCIEKDPQNREREKMALADLKNVLHIFGGSEVTEDQQNDLFKEVLLMTLARAADADINIQNVEVDRIREIIKDHTGEEVSAADVRVAARAELYAEANLRKYLGKVAHKMKPEHRGKAIQALADVFRSDADVSVLEIDFFDRTATAMGVTPSQLAGLNPGAVD